MKFNMQYRAIIKNADGSVAHDSGYQQSRSFVYAFLAALYNMMSGTAITVTNYTGGAGSMTANAINLNTIGSYTTIPADTTHGIQVGTSNAPVLYNNYALGSRIANGVSPNQLLYGIQYAPSSPSYTGTTVEIHFLRTFSNGGSSPVVINEIGMVGECYNTGYYYWVRDVVTPLSVAAGQTIHIDYRLYVSV